MKILLISDTHGELNRVYKILDKIRDFDLVIHCGDFISDAEELENIPGVGVIAVSGNCDHRRKIKRKFVETPAGKLLVVHGHDERVDCGLTTLMYEGMENECLGVCFGHTHIPCVEEMDGMYLMNPGSLTRPRDGSGGSFIIIRATEKTFYADIVYYDTVVSDKKRAKGGFVRGLLNYSDRF